jgi:hypothetical protein
MPEQIPAMVGVSAAYGVAALWAALLLPASLRRIREPRAALRDKFQLAAVAFATVGCALRCGLFANFRTATAQDLQSVLSNLFGYWMLFHVRTACVGIYAVVVLAIKARNSDAYATRKRFAFIAVAATFVLNTSLVATSAVIIASNANFDSPTPIPPPLQTLWAATILSSDLFALLVVVGFAAFIQRAISRSWNSSVMLCLTSRARMREVFALTLSAFLSAASFVLRAAENIAELSSPPFVTWAYVTSRRWFIPVFYLIVELFPVVVLLAALTYIKTLSVRASIDKPPRLVEQPLVQS